MAEIELARWTALDFKVFKARAAYNDARAGFGMSGFTTTLKCDAKQERPWIVKGAFLEGQWQDQAFDNFDRFEEFVLDLLACYADPEDVNKAHMLDRKLSNAYGPYLSQVWVWHELGRAPRFELRNMLDGIGGNGVRTSRFFDLNELEIAVEYHLKVPPVTWRRDRWGIKHEYNPDASVDEMLLATSTKSEA